MTVTDLEEGDQQDAVEQAPPVVAVVVTHDPGPWFDECLLSLTAQDYPNLSILVIDAASEEPVLARAAASAPAAYVRRLEANPGFGPAANDVLTAVEGAAFFLLCHDDVVLAPTAVWALVEEAYRSNAGIVGPKLVDWDAPERLLQVGMSVDKGGVTAPIVERGELDQEQHDAVRDVFLIPGACTLVRADLFVELGGFDPEMSFLGEDLDLCWRAQVAGARVVVVPGAAAKHREVLVSRIDPDEARQLRNRHRVRTVLTCYGPLQLFLVVPQLLALAVAEAGWALVTGKRRHARDVVSAWWWNLRRLDAVRARRKALRAVREFPDSEVRRLQVSGSSRLRRFLRGELDIHPGLRAQVEEIEREFEETVRSPSRRFAFAAWAVVLLLFVFGARHLLFQRLPAVGGIAPFDESAGDVAHRFLSGWRDAGLGGEAPAPTAFGLLALAGTALLGGMGLLQQIVVLGLLPAGWLGAWSLSRGLSSPGARAAGLAAYALNPLPWDALASGSWAGLVVYAVAPWCLRSLIAATGEPPTDLPDAVPGQRWRWLRLGMLLAVGTAFLPLLPVLVIGVAVALSIGLLLTGGARATRGPLATVVGAAAVVAVLNLPWLLDFVLPGGDWTATAGIAPFTGDRLSLPELLRFDTGPVGLAWLGWALPAGAVLALVIGVDWRFRWAARCWTVVIASWALAWVCVEGLGGVPLPPAELVLAPGAAALSLAAALGVVAFQQDLRGFRFGWRQLASFAAAAGLAVSLLPVLAAAADGRWNMPRTDLASALDFTAEGTTSYRTLWIGHPAVLPVASFRLDDRLGYGLTLDVPSGVAQRWAAPTYGATALVGDAVSAAARGETDRLGRLLAPFGIRWIVLAEQAAPDREDGERFPLPSGLVGSFARQLDLRGVDVDPAMVVYENTAAGPVFGVLPDDAASQLDRSSVRAPLTLDLSQAVAGLAADGPDAARGSLRAGELYAAVAADGGWELSVDHERVARRRVFGWANGWSTNGGDADLVFHTPWTRHGAVFVEAAVWLLAIGVLVMQRRRGRTA